MRGAIARLTAHGAARTFSPMDPTPATTLSRRLRRFVRWFFTVSPDAVLDPPPAPTTVAKARRSDSPRLRAQNSGRVHVADRGRR